MYLRFVAMILTATATMYAVNVRGDSGVESRSVE